MLVFVDLLWFLELFDCFFPLSSTATRSSGVFDCIPFTWEDADWMTMVSGYPSLVIFHLWIVSRASFAQMKHESTIWDVKWLSRYLYIRIAYQPCYHHHRITSGAHSNNLDRSPKGQWISLVASKAPCLDQKKCHRQLLLRFAAPVLHRLESEFLRSKSLQIKPLSFWLN